MDPATSFGCAADLYDRIRPSYPVAAIRWILGERPLRVVDLGAGTGILTRQLAALGHEVIAVEPDAGMRGLIAGNVSVVDGRAEAIPLADAAVDAVVAGQAYHWFDKARAHPEIARVVRPGGVFGPLWNLRDEEEPWVAELTARLSDETADRPGHDVAMADPSFGSGFGPVERAFFPHSIVHTVDTLLALVHSRSYYLTAGAVRRAAIDAGVHELVTTHPDLAGRDEFELPYVTAAYRARRL
jgi:SAM-dependent methyltransferase